MGGTPISVLNDNLAYESNSYISYNIVRIRYEPITSV